MNFYGKMMLDGYLFKDYEIVSVDKSEPNKFGVSRSLELDESLDIPLFINFKNSLQTISFDLIKVDDNRNLLKITEKDRFELQRRLFGKNGYSVLQLKEKNNLLFYGAFVGDSTETYMGGMSYISLEFKLASPYCYSSIITDYYQVIGDKTIEIYNKSNGREELDIDLDIEMIEGNNIEIINTTNGSKVALSNMEVNEKLSVYGDTKEFLSKVDDARNLYKLSSKSNIKLKYGRNVIKINTSKAKVKFIYQYEIQLY